MARFLIDPHDVKDGEIYLSQKETHHAVSVYRTKIGDVLELIDGKGAAYRGIALSVENRRLRIALEKKSTGSSGSEAGILLAMSLIKPELMDLVIQKACELNVRCLIPLVTDRTIIRLSADQQKKKHERWQKISQESAKQCGRLSLPEIRPITPLRNFLETSLEVDKIFIPTLCVESVSLKEAIQGQTAKKVLVLIGPEGDFTPKETALAMALGAEAVSLGPLIMRAETAAIYMLSVLNFLL